VQRIVLIGLNAYHCRLHGHFNVTIVSYHTQLDKLTDQRTFSSMHADGSKIQKHLAPNPNLASLLL